MPVNFQNEEEVKEYLDNLGTEYRYGCFSEKDPEACHLLGEYLDIIKRDHQKAGRIFKTNCDDYKHPRSCHSYGNLAIIGKGMEKKNEDVAYTYFTKACDLDVPNACLNAGILAFRLSTEENKEKEYAKGLELLNKSCDLKYSFACYYLSGLYIKGSQNNSVVQKDMKKAFAYSQRACDLGNIYGCLNLSLMYKKGDGVEKNEEMSEKFKKKVEELKNEVDSGFTMEFQRS